MIFNNIFSIFFKFRDIICLFYCRYEESSSPNAVNYEERSSSPNQTSVIVQSGNLVEYG